MTDRMAPVYKELADLGGNFWGDSIMQHEKVIYKLLRKTDSRTALDFGCGRGDPWKRYSFQDKLRLDSIALYDPAFPKHDKLPDGTFDAVLCSDVLEHVPEDEVVDFVNRLFDYAEKMVWASVCCRPAKKKLPDGTNMHVTVRPIEWWQDVFLHAQARANRKGKVIAFRLTETP
jgi:hypothetical protein